MIHVIGTFQERVKSCWNVHVNHIKLPGNQIKKLPREVDPMRFCQMWKGPHHFGVVGPFNYNQ